MQCLQGCPNCLPVEFDVPEASREPDPNNPIPTQSCVRLKAICAGAGWVWLVRLPLAVGQLAHTQGTQIYVNNNHHCTCVCVCVCVCAQHTEELRPKGFVVVVPHPLAYKHKCSNEVPSL